jgi:hypothetical protein
MANEVLREFAKDGHCYAEYKIRNATLAATQDAVSLEAEIMGEILPRVISLARAKTKITQEKGDLDTVFKAEAWVFDIDSLKEFARAVYAEGKKDAELGG